MELAIASENTYSFFFLIYLSLFACGSADEILLGPWKSLLR